MINDRNRIKIIFSQIDKLATKSGVNILEYQKYVDMLSEHGDYDNLLQCLYFFYEIDIDRIITLEDVKYKTWDKIMFRTNNTFTKKLKKLYDINNIYQTGIDVYTSNVPVGSTFSSIYLGQIIEQGIYNDEAKYYIKNREYARLTGTRKTILRVIKNNIETIIDINDIKLSEEKNLYSRYVDAVNILLT